MKRAGGVIRLHMGCGEALTSRVHTRQPANADAQHTRAKRPARKPGKEKR